MTFPITTTATRLRAGVRVDRMGDSVEDWAGAEQRTYEGVLFYPNNSTETLAAGLDTTVDTYTLHLPYGDDTTAKDRFVVAGVMGVWLVDGNPKLWPIREPGWDYGTAVILKRLE